MAASVEQRVKEIICEQLGVSEDEVTPRGVVHRGSRAPTRSTSSSW